VLSTGDLLLHQPRAVGISEHSVVQARRAPPLGGAQILCYLDFRCRRSVTNWATLFDKSILALLIGKGRQ
jgi:hypothetical protein